MILFFKNQLKNSAKNTLIILDKVNAKKKMEKPYIQRLIRKTIIINFKHMHIANIFVFNRVNQKLNIYIYEVCP